MVGTKHRDRHLKSIESFLSYKSAEASRIQTYFYGLAAIAVYAIFEVGNKVLGSQFLNGLLVCTMIFSCAGYYFWYITEMVVQRHVECLGEIADMKDHLECTEFQSARNTDILLDLEQKELLLRGLWSQGHLLSLGGAIVATLSLLVAAYLYSFTIILDVTVLIVLIPMLVLTLVIMICSHHHSIFKATD